MAKKAIPGAAREPEPERTQGVKVMATAVGYYDHKRRRVGDVFVISGEKYEADVLWPPTPKDHPMAGQVRFKKGDLKFFSSRWMERVAASTPERETSAPEALKAAQEDLRAAKGTGSQTVI